MILTILLQLLNAKTFDRELFLKKLYFFAIRDGDILHLQSVKSHVRVVHM